MEKYFNVAGPCVAADHYMVPTERRCARFRELVRQKSFFVVHAPRQTGKTTLIQDVVRQINEEGKLLAIYCSVETAQGVDDTKQSMPIILSSLREAIRYNAFADEKTFGTEQDPPPEMALKIAITQYCARIKKPLVIMFDEVDCLSNNTLLSFLRQLRQGYVERGAIPFLHAAALVGMRNIRDYKAQLRPESGTLGSASPFNVVTEALTVQNFTSDEIAELYRQHTEATGQEFSAESVARVAHDTHGQPWLCNAIAREILVNLLKGDTKQPVKLEHVEQAVENIILRRDTHIDSLLERLKEPRVRSIVEPVILGQRINLDFTDDNARYTFDLGLLEPGKGDVAPANPIYGEVIIRMLTLNSQYHLPNELEGRFIQKGRLDMRSLLQEFQQFWRENSDIWVEKYEYKEAAPHLILQAFLQRVVNGGGRINREYSAGRGRIDLCVSLGAHRYPIELKIQYAEQTRDQGALQLIDYLDRLGLDEGWLVVFNRDATTSWDAKITWEDREQAGKLLHIVGC